MERLEEAIEAYKKAVEIDNDFITSQNNIGRGLAILEQNDEAFSAYECSLEIDLNDSTAQKGMGDTLIAIFDAGEIDKAKNLACRWRKNFPDNPFVKHIVPLIMNENVSGRANDEYVRDTFNDFASSFDEVLKKLDYAAPKQIADALGKCLKSDGKKLNILDAGCGTGGCAVYLKPLAKKLTGIDLSGDMLKKAKETSAYDELKECEITSFLKKHKNSYDLIVAADVFCYFGELKEAFFDMKNALRPNGAIALTLEQEKDICEKGFNLTTSGRYTHSQSYLTSIIEDSGLTIEQLDTNIELRSEYDKKVYGLLAVVRKQ